MNYLIILFFVLSMIIYSQPNVMPSPSLVGKTYEEITTQYPTYWADPHSWYGKIAYYNTVIPGKVDFYFIRNKCYAIQAIFSSEDSISTWNAFLEYDAYVNTILNGNSTIVQWKYPDYRKVWSSPNGSGIIMFSASNIKYNQISSDGKLYYYCLINMISNSQVVNEPYPSNKPKVKLQ